MKGGEGSALEPDGVGELPPASRELMEVLWAAETPCTGRMVHDRIAVRFPTRRKRAYTSTATLLQRLVDRGYIDIDANRPNRYTYRPKVSRSAGLAAAASAVVDEFCYRPSDGWYLVQAFLREAELDELTPAGDKRQLIREGPHHIVRRRRGRG